MLRGVLIFGLAVTASACAANKLAPSLSQGAAAYQAFPETAATAPREDYRIGPFDAIDVTVFSEPDLSAKGTIVDASGKIALPLIGSAVAAGKTASELSDEITRRLAENILVHPQVSVVVSASVSQKLTVEGEVAEPGVYEIKGPTSLLEAIAMAKGESQVAALKQVVVFRTMNGQRFGAVFDVKSIRNGLAEDPQVHANDVVVVGLSPAKKMWHDIVSAAPLLNVFRPLSPLGY